MAQLFKKERRFWSSADQEQAQYFFQCNQFFSKIYSRLYFEDIVQLAYYSKITSKNPIFLTDNKRPAAIILLKGDIAIYKRNNKLHKLKKKQQYEHSLQQLAHIPEFIKISQCIRYNQTFIQSSQCKVTTLHSQQAQILFVPSFLYNKLIQKTRQQKDKTTFDLLTKIFRKAQNRYIMDLAKSGCKIRQFKINNYIYEEGQKPEFVYIIIQGSAKIQRPGFSHRNFQIVVVSSQSLLGEKDICFSQRQSSAICCSSHIRLLQIPKQAFLKFSKNCLPQMKFPQKKQAGSSSISKSKSRQLSPKKQQQTKLPIIMRFRSAKKSQQQEMREYNLIKNSHILLEATKPSKKKIRSKSSYEDYPKDIMQQKIKLFKKLRPVQTKLDLSNRIL